MADGSRVGVVLAGGGARGAYELGALSVLLPALEKRGERPSILVGTSVGAINAAGLASTQQLPAKDALSQELARWGEVERAAVIGPLLQRLPLSALRFAGGVLGLPGVRLESLLNPAPLERNLRRWIDWAQLHRNVASGSVFCLAVIATAARTGHPVAFVEGQLDATAHNSHVIDYVPALIEQTHVPVYDRDAAERHLERTLDLWRRNLSPSNPRAHEPPPQLACALPPPSTSKRSQPSTGAQRIGAIRLSLAALGGRARVGRPANRPGPSARSMKRVSLPAAKPCNHWRR